MHLPDDLLLLSIRHRERLSFWQRWHLTRCIRCQEQQQTLGQALDADLPEFYAAPPWSDVAPRVASPAPRLKIAWAVPILLALAVLVAWPKLVWRNAPLAPTALSTLLAAPSATLRPTTPIVHGRVSVRANRAAGWMLLQYRNVTPLRRGLVYEVWWIVGDRHIRAGVFDIHHAEADLWLHTPVRVAGATAVGITIEPAPGVSHPTGLRTFFASLPPTP
ncbi:MAG: anti-sigma factor [Firmicutes bacterium]|nr:anti-sigma factor [Bacillota bacterium]